MTGVVNKNPVTGIHVCWEQVLARALAPVRPGRQLVLVPVVETPARLPAELTGGDLVSKDLRRREALSQC